MECYWSARERGQWNVVGHGAAWKSDAAEESDVAGRARLWACWSLVPTRRREIALARVSSGICSISFDGHCWRWNADEMNVVLMPADKDRSVRRARDSSAGS